jgi:type II secretory pathway pseudopilin PulG
MKNNQKGFSLVELLAILVLFSVVLVPLLFSFNNSLLENRKAMTARVSASIAEGALYAIEKISFSDYRSSLDTAQNGGDLALELNEDECATVFTSATDIAVCDGIFSMTSASVSFNAATFRIFLFDYALTTAEHASLVNDTNLPQSVRNEINENADILAAITESPPATQNLIWVMLWIDYYDDPDQFLVTTAILANDDPVYFE